MDYKEHFEERNRIIDLLDEQKIDKQEFIMRNLQCYEGTNFLKLPKHFDSLEEALYHYQFHNSKAKYFKWKYMESIESQRIFALECKNKSLFHYEQKEAVTLLLLKDFYSDHGKISAYYLKMNSKALDGKLVEIVFHEYERVVLHSLDKKVIDFLKFHSILTNEPKSSLIDGYVNERFY